MKKESVQTTDSASPIPAQTSNSKKSLPSIRRGTVLWDGSRSKVVVLVTKKEGQKQANKTVNLTVQKMERNLNNPLRIGKELTRDTTLR